MLLHLKLSISLVVTLIVISVLGNRPVKPLPGNTTKGGSQLEKVGFGSNPVSNCTEETCNYACGLFAEDIECLFPGGFCQCFNPTGPPRRCRNPRHENEECTVGCRRSVSQICFTDYGNLCTCFLRTNNK